MAVLVEADRLRKSFGPILAVEDISLKVEKGEVLGFLGPNGAGKSTTMKMLTGFLEPDAGRARICGISVANNPKEAKSRLGYLPEGAPAYGDMTARSFLNFIAEVRGYDGASKFAHVDAAIARTGLEGVEAQRIETLSKGYKRRVGLAQAILHDPEVLIMDEPTDGLDPNQKHHVRSLQCGCGPHCSSLSPRLPLRFRLAPSQRAALSARPARQPRDRGGAAAAAGRRAVRDARNRGGRSLCCGRRNGSQLAAGRRWASGTCLR